MKLTELEAAARAATPQTLRIITRYTDCGAAANVGGPVIEAYRTFDVDLPELVAYLTAPRDNQWVTRTVIGAELVPAIAALERTE